MHAFSQPERPKLAQVALCALAIFFGYRAIMENHMEKKMDDETETLGPFKGVDKGYVGV